MLVGVNTTSVEPGRGGGDEHYLCNVMVTMRKVQPDFDFLVFTDAGSHGSFEGWDRVCLGRAAELEHAAKRAKVDLLFTSLRTALPKSSVPQVPFALELMALEKDTAKRHRRDAARLKVLKRTCKDAAAVVVPSQFLRRECLELLDVPLDKVVVAPLGVAQAFGKPQPCVAQQPYILTVVGSHEFNNIPRLREALTKLRSEIPHSLIVVGQPGETEPEDWGRRVIRVYQCPTTHLAGLYQHCDLFIYPVLYEGSGVMVLEAMRAGAPIASSRVGGIPEIAGDIPFFFNPESVASIIAAVRRVLEENPDNRERRARFGKQLAAEYTWENCAWKTVAAFRQAVV